MGERKYCYNCMEKYDAMQTICPNCGHDERTPHNPMYITPGTILHDRYLIGVLISYNGEGATYLSLDTATGCKVMIREYMPINLCTRVKNKSIISVNYNNLAKYKAFMAEYTELNKSLARLRNNSNITPVLDMFAENNTTYTVFENIEGMKLLDYLKDNAGELSWEQVSKLFPPLFTTIGILHNAGIIHRAISPETVFISNKGELKISGFCVSAVRTANAGLEYELYKGYAAPEQYSASSSSRQGSWTDVYSVSALLYRILTGCMPSDSLSRLEHDDLCEPHRLNSRIPAHVSRVIMDGMNLSGRDRIQTITELVTRLFEQPAPVKNLYQTAAPVPENSRENYSSNYNQPQSQQPAYNDNGYYDDGNDYNDGYDNYNDGYEEEYRYEKVNAVDRFKVPIIIGILLLAILMIIAVAFLNLFSRDDDTDNSIGFSSVADNVVEVTTTTTTQTTTEAGDGIMFELRGKFFDITKEKYADYFELVAEYEYNDEYAADQIFEQEIAVGEPFVQGQKITVKVSKGKEIATIPDFKGYTITQYENILKQEGIINYSLVPESTATSGTPNTVTQLLVDGKKVNPGDTFSNKDGKNLVVYYLSSDAVIVTTTTTFATTTTAAETTTTAAPVVTEPPTTEAPVVTEPVTDPPVVTDQPVNTDEIIDVQ